MPLIYTGPGSALLTSTSTRPNQLIMSLLQRYTADMEAVRSSIPSKIEAIDAAIRTHFGYANLTAAARYVVAFAKFTNH